MTALLRAHLRALLTDPVSATWGLLFPCVPAFTLVFLGGLQGAPGAFVRTLGLAAVFGVAGHLRGRGSTPAGVDPFARPMPMLPVSDRARTVGVVLLAEALLLGAVATVDLAAWALLHDAAPTQPFAGLGLAPAALAPALLTFGLAWLPFLVAGARVGNALTGRMLVVGTAVAAALTTLRVDLDLPRAAAWAVLGTFAATRLGRPRLDGAPRGDLRVRPGLRGLLTSMSLQTAVLVALAGGVGVATGAMLGEAREMLGSLPAITWTLACILPILPGAATPGRIGAAAPEVLFRLPVARGRALGALVLAHLARATLVVGPAFLIAVAARGLPPAPVLAVGGATFLLSVTTMAVTASFAPRLQVLLAWAGITVLSVVAMLIALRPEWPVGGAVAALTVLAAGGGVAALKSLGHLGPTGRPVG